MKKLFRYYQLFITGLFLLLIFGSATFVYNSFLRVSTTQVQIGTTTADSVLTVTGGIHATGGVILGGDLRYNFAHGVAYGTALNYTPNLVQNVPFKLTPGLTVIEQDGVIIRGDSIISNGVGDYVVDVCIQFIINNNVTSTDLYVNNVAYNHAKMVSDGSTNSTQTINWRWYLVGIATNSNLCFKMTNTSGNNDPTIGEFHVYIYKTPE